MESHIEVFDPELLRNLPAYKRLNEISQVSIKKPSWNVAERLRAQPVRLLTWLIVGRIEPLG